MVNLHKMFFNHSLSWPASLLHHLVSSNGELTLTHLFNLSLATR